eukprot:170344-Hanusia_phi.AAC.5
MEDTLFELSLVHEVFDPEVMEGREKERNPCCDTEEWAADANKSSKCDEMQDVDSPSILDLQEFDQMRQEMEAFDEKREIVIKKCRDLQKLCKAKKQLDGVKESSNVRFDHIMHGTSNGAFEGVMEEYAEAYLFYQFLHDGRILELGDLEVILRALLEPFPFLGSLLPLLSVGGCLSDFSCSQSRRMSIWVGSWTSLVKLQGDVQIVLFACIVDGQRDQVCCCASDQARCGASEEMHGEKLLKIAQRMMESAGCCRSDYWLDHRHPRHASSSRSINLKKLENIIYEMSLSRKPQSKGKEEQAQPDESA